MIAIVAHSKYGYTEKYARWLGEMLQTEQVAINPKDNRWLSADVILFGGSIHAGKIRGMRQLQQNLALLKEKKVAVFAVGATPVSDAMIQTVKEKNWKPGMEHMPCFVLRGGMDCGRMTWIDRTLIGMMRRMIKKRPADQREDWETALLQCGNRPVDFTHKESLQPLITWLSK